MTIDCRSRHFWTFIVAILAALHFVAGGLLSVTPDFKSAIASSNLTLDSGKAYVTNIKIGRWQLYAMPTDDNGAPTKSDLKLFEDGRPLGPAHSLHADIRAKGDGRYSHWQNAIIFSSSDGSDPRTNGRSYSMTSSTDLRLRLRAPIVSFLAFADLLLFLKFRRQTAAFVQPRKTLLTAGTAAVVALLAALSALGVFGTTSVAFPGLAKDTALVVSVTQHAALGCFTSIALWAAGAGLYCLLERKRTASLPSVLIPAFPISLLVLAVLLAIALVVPSGRIVALVLWFACLLPLVSWRPPRAQIASAAKAGLTILPLAMAFGIWLGLLWHGPTDTMPGAPTGDLTFYVGSMWSLAEFPFPNVDLGYEAGASRGYFNNLYPAFGAALLHVPGFDPFLFMLASGGTSYVLLSTLMLHLYITDRVRHPIDILSLATVVLTLIVAARYPYWVAESIPMVVVPALTISVWWMAERGQRILGWSIAGMLAGLIGSILSKVVIAAVLVPLAAAGLWKTVRTLPSAIRVAGLVIAGLFGAYCIYMLAKFLPLFSASTTIGPESYRTPGWIYTLRDASASMLVVLAWLTTKRLIALALTFGMATFLAFSWVFQANFVCVTLVLGLVTVATPRLSVATRIFALAALAISLPAALLGDIAGASSGFMWLLCLGGGTLIAVLSAVDLTRLHLRFTLPVSALVAATTFAIAAIALVGVARGTVIVDSGWHIQAQQRLSPQLKEIWSSVRQSTPKDALIFTDQVDDTESTLGGWNTFAYSGQRHVFLSSYVTTFALRNDRAKLRDVLAVNDAVLAGTRAPRDVATQFSYGSYYAVVSATRQTPSGWRKVFSNSLYALYEIAPSQ